MSGQVHVINVDNLLSHYGKRIILKEISLTIYDGEIVVIMGGSGSGKSTLLRHLLALKKPTSGKVSVFGYDLNYLSFHEKQKMRRKMGVSFQGGALFNSMTVGDNVCLPLREHTQLDEATINIMCRMKLEMVNLAGFENFMPSELSGGMIKRAALARAIIMDPQLLFFDEPSAGLDPVIAAELDNLILRLRKAMNMTIIVVTHDLDSAFKIADRIIVLDKGEILTNGTVDHICKSDNERIQNLLNRRMQEQEFNPEAYFSRLTD
jgi:phospholipid/cholesterol/gamma-HCH transport system ATP-binding protein